MGIKKIEIKVCDCCGKEITGRLIVRVCPCCGKDICVECQLKEDARHKPKPRKVEPVLAPPGSLSVTMGVNQVPFTESPPAKKRMKKAVTTKETGRFDLSTFSVLVGQGDDLSQIRLGAQVVGCKTLKEGVKNILAKLGIDKAYVEAAPESEGRTQLLAILKEV